MTYIVANPTHDGRFTGAPYGLAPRHMGFAPRYSGQRVQRIRCANLRTRRRSQYATLGLANSTALSAGVKAAQIGLNFVPIVGPILSQLVGPITGIFTQAHAAAVAKEGSTLNGAVPQFVQTVQGIMAALNAGQISPAAAISALQQAQSTYYSAVASIMKKGGACKTPNQGSTAGNDQCPINNSGLWRDCAAAGNCNASCAIACGMVEPTVSFLTAIIQAGGGSFNIPATPVNGAIQGSPAVTVTYNGSQGGGGVAGAVASIPSWYYLAGGGLLLLFLLMR